MHAAFRQTGPAGKIGKLEPIRRSLAALLRELRDLIHDLRRTHNCRHQFLGTLFVARRFRHSLAIRLIDRMINRLTLVAAACLIQNIVSCSIY